MLDLIVIAAFFAGAKPTSIVDEAEADLDTVSALLAGAIEEREAPHTLSKWWSTERCLALRGEEPPAVLRAVRRAQRRGGLVMPALSAAGDDKWLGLNNVREVSEEMAVVAFLTGRRIVQCGRKDRAQSKLLRGNARDTTPFSDLASDVWVRRGWDEALVERVLAPRDVEGAEGSAKTTSMSNGEICVTMDRAATREAQLGGPVVELDLRLSKGHTRLSAWLRLLSEPRIASAAVLTDSDDWGGSDYLFGLDGRGDEATSDASAAALNAVRQLVLRFRRHCLHPQDDVFNAASTIAQDVLLNRASPLGLGLGSVSSVRASPAPRYHALNVRFKYCVSAPVADCERLGVGRISRLPGAGWSFCQHTSAGVSDLCADEDATSPFAKELFPRNSNAPPRLEALEPRGALTQVGALRRSGACDACASSARGGRARARAERRCARLPRGARDRRARARRAAAVPHPARRAVPARPGAPLVRAGGLHHAVPGSSGDVADRSRRARRSRNREDRQR